jgi:hypothetical protein
MLMILLRYTDIIELLLSTQYLNNNLITYYYIFYLKILNTKCSNKNFSLVFRF